MDSGEIPSGGKPIIYRSKLPDIAINNTRPLHEYCLERLPEVSDRPCLIDAATGKTLTYADVDRLSRLLAENLHRRLGISKGDVIMNLLRNSSEFVLAFLAASRLNAAVTTANPFYTPGEIRKQVSDSAARVIITESIAVHKVRHIPDITIVTIDDGHSGDGCLSFSDLLADTNDEPLIPPFDASAFDPDDVVALPYSSGTTGLPKGVMLTHRSLTTSAAQQVDGENANIDFREEDVILCTLPMFHIYSLNTILMCGMRVGAAILVVKKHELEAMLALVERYKVTVAPLVPPVVVMVAKSDMAAEKYDLSTIRMVLSGAAPLGKETQDAFRKKLPNAILGQGYGMTEAGPVLSMCLAFAKHPFEAKSGACGTVVRNAELKIIDTVSGASLGRNTPGEICIRGQQIMKGYLNDPEATRITIDEDGWLHTGDVGYVDDDDEILIVDRLKDIIKYKGYQVAPAELEALLLTCSDIKDAAIVGKKDELVGELPVAFVVRKDGSDISEDKIKKFVADQVIFYKRIHQVQFVESIPKAPSGKILKKDLRAQLEA